MPISVYQHEVLLVLLSALFCVIKAFSPHRYCQIGCVQYPPQGEEPLAVAHTSDNMGIWVWHQLCRNSGNLYAEPDISSRSFSSALPAASGRACVRGTGAYTQPTWTAVSVLWDQRLLFNKFQTFWLKCYSGDVQWDKLKLMKKKSSTHCAVQKAEILQVF